MSYLDEVNELLKEAAAVAAAKMVIHKDKGPWENKYTSVEALLEGLEAEVREAKEATTSEELILECGDIVNYAAMIIVMARRQFKREGRDE